MYILYKKTFKTSGKKEKRRNYGSNQLIAWIRAFYDLYQNIYRVSHFIGNSKFGIKILFDGRGYGGKIFSTVSFVYWVQCTFIENGVKTRVREKLIFK